MLISSIQPQLGNVGLTGLICSPLSAPQHLIRLVLPFSMPSLLKIKEGVYLLASLTIPLQKPSLSSSVCISSQLPGSWCVSKWSIQDASYTPDIFFSGKLT